MSNAPRASLLSTYAAPAIAERFVHARRRVGGRLVAGMFERAAQITRLAPAAQPQRHGVEVVRDVPYLGTGRVEHTLDVYRPTAPPPPGGWPVVFYVHGGAFRSLSKDTHWLMGLAFARRGFVTVLPNYRLAPQHRFPAGLEDTVDALAFVRAHAHAWGGDPARVVFAGESAGGNLVTSLALAIAYEREEPYARRLRALDVEPLAVLAACAPLEVTTCLSRYEERFGKLGWFFEDRYSELAQGYARLEQGACVGHDLMDPLVLVEREAPRRKLPPFFLPVGTLDHLKEDHFRMERALRAHGGDVEAPLYPGEVHAFHAFIWRENARKCWQDHFDFLHARGVPVARLHIDGVTRA